MAWPPSPAALSTRPAPPTSSTPSMGLSGSPTAPLSTWSWARRTTWPSPPGLPVPPVGPPSAHSQSSQGPRHGEQHGDGQHLDGDPLPITAATPATGGPGTLTCTPTAAINGVATFTGCSIDTAGTAYQLHASDDVLTPADSAAFDVTVGTASQLVFTTQPGDAVAGAAFGTQPVVTIEDAGATRSLVDIDPISTSIASGAGTLSGCSETTTSGVGTFSGCSIDTAGPYMLRADDGPFHSLSDFFTVTS